MPLEVNSDASRYSRNTIPSGMRADAEFHRNSRTFQKRYPAKSEEWCDGWAAQSIENRWMRDSYGEMIMMAFGIGQKPGVKDFVHQEIMDAAFGTMDEDERGSLELWSFQQDRENARRLLLALEEKGFNIQDPQRIPSRFGLSTIPGVLREEVAEALLWYVRYHEALEQEKRLYDNPGPVSAEPQLEHPEDLRVNRIREWLG